MQAQISLGNGDLEFTETELGRIVRFFVPLAQKKYIYIYCETWMRLCQANWQENKRNVPKSPLLTARKGGLTVYATPWSQKWGRHFGSLSFFR